MIQPYSKIEEKAYQQSRFIGCNAKKLYETEILILES